MALSRSLKRKGTQEIGQKLVGNWGQGFFRRNVSMGQRGGPQTQKGEEMTDGQIAEEAKQRWQR